MIFLSMIDTDDTLRTLGVNGLYIEGVLNLPVMTWPGLYVLLDADTLKGLFSVACAFA